MKRGEPVSFSLMTRPLPWVLAALFPLPSSVLAQSYEGGDGQSIVLSSPDSSNAARQRWLQQDLDDMKARSRRARNALIATSATVGVGTVFMAIGASQCQVISQPGQNDTLLCNSAGDVLFPLGFGAVVLGAIGMLTSGIILGVANKRQRQIKSKLREAQYGRRIQFDAASGGFVF